MRIVAYIMAADANMHVAKIERRFKGRVYFSSGTEFFCLGADDGSLVWRTPSGRPGRPGQYAYSSPALVDGSIYTAANDAVFYALNAETGAVKWRYETSGGNPFLFSPALAEGRLLAATGEFNPYACAVDPATGIAAWSFKAPGASFFLSSPAISNGTAYLGMGAPDQTLFALDLATGVEKWRRTLGYSNTFGFTSSPAVVGSLTVSPSPVWRRHRAIEQSRLCFPAAAPSARLRQSARSCHLWISKPSRCVG